MRRSKKDLDMESMFQKIMPSAAGGKVENPIAPQAAEIDPSAEGTPADSGSAAQELPVAGVPASPVGAAAKTASAAAKAKTKPKTSTAATPAFEAAPEEAAATAPVTSTAESIAADSMAAAAVPAASAATAPIVAAAAAPVAGVETNAAASSAPSASGVASSAPQVQPVPDPAPVEAPMLINLVRPFLESRLDAALDKFNCCKCEKCQLDVLAVALNKVPPQYAMLPQSAEPLAYVTAELARESVTGLIQSIFQIKSHPRH